MGRWKLASGLVAGLVLMGCGGLFMGSENGVGGGGGGGGSKVTAAELQALGDAVHAAGLAPGLNTRGQVVAAQLNAMKANPACKNAVHFPKTDTLGCTLRDSTPYSFIDNRPIVQGAPIPPLPQQGDEVPLSKKAFVVFSMGNAFQDDTNLFRSWLTPIGYNVSRSTGSLDTMINLIKDAGFLYIFAHGGESATSDNTPVFVLTTTTEVTDAMDRDAIVSAMLASGELAKARCSFDIIPNPVDTNQNGTIDDREQMTYKSVYALTPKFVAKYFQFRQGSFVVNAACTSMDQSLVGGFDLAGADTYAGFDAPCPDDGNVVRRLVDHLIGQNKIDPDADPDRRPFKIDQVYAFLKSRGFTRVSHLNDEGTRAELLYARLTNGGDFGLLRPTITKIKVVEANAPGIKDQIVIEGVFGPYSPSTPREVRVDGVPLNIISDGGPRDNRIVCEIPRRGTGSAGPCIVKVNGRESLPVPITEWIVNMDYDFDGPGSCQYHCDLTLTLRADVHRNRDEETDTPKGWTIVHFSRGDTSMSYNASGSGGGQTWSGSGTIKSLQEGTPPDVVAFQGNLDTQQGKWLNVLMLSGGGRIDVRYTNGGFTTMPPALALLPFDLLYDPDTFEIVNGTAPGPVTALGQGTLKWSDTAAFFPPTQKTPRKPER